MEKTLSLIKWWLTLPLKDKLWVIMWFMIIILGIVVIKLHNTNTNQYNRNLGCEQRLTAAVLKERDRGDSLRAVDQKFYLLEKEALFNLRTTSIKERNANIEKVLKDEK